MEGKTKEESSDRRQGLSPPASTLPCTTRSVRPVATTSSLHRMIGNNIDGSVVRTGRIVVPAVLLPSCPPSSPSAGDGGVLLRTQFAVDHSSDQCLYVNDSSCRRLGYSREELLGMTIYDIDPGAPRPWSSHFQEIKERGSFTFESSLRTKAGEIIPVDVTVNYVNYGGQEYNCATSRDITERKRGREAAGRKRAQVPSGGRQRL